MKFGYQAAYHRVNQSYFSQRHAPARTDSTTACPNLLTMDLKPFKTGQRTRWEALYAQEQWTLGRLTLQGALRFDHAWSYFPDQQIGPVTFLPTPLLLPKRSRASSATTTSRRAAVSPTTCSATARRR